MNLTEAKIGQDCIVKDIAADDEELKSFLFSLGCYSGETVWNGESSNQWGKAGHYK